MQLSFLYRGPLESCNYGCVYCPFAKKKDTRAELSQDRVALERFIDWVESRKSDRISVLVTPWGEALIRRWYQEGLARLTRLAHVERAAVQTNLSCDLDWIERAGANPSRLGIWATFHPEWTPRAPFIEKIRRLHASGVRVSCGVVGFNRFADQIERLRDDLPEGVYLWINAAKSHEQYETKDIERFLAIDPLFEINTHKHASLGRSCRAGASVVSVDGENGDVRRCHFIDTVIGNLYDGSFDRGLAERPCTNDTCGCHIGYVHLDDLDLYRTFEGGILERIPATPVWSSPSRRRLSVLAT